MLEKFKQIAEQAASSASRREFLGRLGRGALTAAASVSGVLAFAPQARAGRVRARCCFYRCHWNSRGDQGVSHHVCHAEGSACVASFVLRRSGRYVQVCRLRSESLVRNCGRCGS
jgi:hypothetical protein